MVEERVFVMRPRPIWLIIAPGLAIAIGYGAVAQRDWGLLILVAMALIWTSYLISARVILDGYQLRIERFGRSRNLVRMDRLESWDVTWWWIRIIPTRELLARDAEGGRLSIESAWWTHWNELRALVMSTGPRKADIRDDLGRFPALKIPLLTVASAMIGFVLLAFRNWDDGPRGEVIRESAIGGAIVGLATGAWIAYDYLKAKRSAKDH